MRAIDNKCECILHLFWYKILTWLLMYLFTFLTILLSLQVKTAVVNDCETMSRVICLQSFTSGGLFFRVVFNAIRFHLQMQKFLSSKIPRSKNLRMERKFFVFTTGFQRFSSQMRGTRT